MNSNPRKLTLTAMLGAMAYLTMLVGRVPVVLFLNYDPKDAVIAIGGFLLGPASAAMLSLVVSLIEMLTASDTGLIGFFMNVLSTWAFVLPAAALYRRHRTLKCAALGLTLGVLCMTLTMLAWNFIITPLYMGYPRAAVAELLLPVFLPFNLFKGVLNAGVTLLLYKPVSRALRRARLLPASEAADTPRRQRLWTTAVSLFAIVTAAACFYLLHRP